MARTIEGKVFDKETNEPLAFAPVVSTDENGVPVEPIERVTTNADGSFRIDVTKGTHLGAKYTGYPKLLLPIAGNTKFDFAMQAGYTLDPVDIIVAKEPKKEETKTIPTWVVWSGVGVIALGVGMLIFGAVKKV